MTEAKKEFTFEDFKKYVNTYDPKKHALNNPRIILDDMLYGVGKLHDNEKFSDYKAFKKYLKDIL
jgi:hypothetical protein